MATEKSLLVRNVGKVDKVFRTLLAIFLIGFGLFDMGGIRGNVSGILVAAIAILPLYIVITGSCFVLRFFRIHSLSKMECEKYGRPYEKD